MTQTPPDRWRRAEELYHAARSRPHDEREGFIVATAGDDPMLLDDVRSLLAQPVSDRFLEQPPLLPTPASGGRSSLIGHRLGGYQVDTLIGVGGMGEVYRARDLRLRRDVALKILPPQFLLDADRLARFNREARVLASLNHPRIAGIYGFEEADGIRALVLELVEGDTLAQRIARGPLRAPEALAIAAQIAEALEAAHEKGIVHRDLKPANISLTPGGAVKVLDFGLAKVTDLHGTQETGAAAHAVTATREGFVLGTVGYMSPEQARGEVVDRRTDVWAFGCVLFEMLTGRAAFTRPTLSETLAAIQDREPELGLLPPETHADITRLLRRTLEKDPRRRLRDIGDAHLEIADVLSGRTMPGPGVAVPMPDPSKVSRSPWRRLTPALIVGVVALVAGFGAGSWIWRQPTLTASVVRLTLDAAPADEITTTSVLNMLPAGGRLALAWSPKGQTLAFIGSRLGTSQVYLRDLASGEARPLDGTEGARVFAYSTDGEWIAFWTGSDLRKIRVSGGPAATICAVAEISGLTWGPTRVVFTTRFQVFEVSPQGGAPHALTEPDKRRSTPFLLPRENALLYTEYGKNFTSGDEQVMIRRLDPPSEPRLLLPEAADARYLPTGHLAFMRQGTLFVTPFDTDTFALSGSPVAVVSNVAQSIAAWFAGDLTLSGQFAVSADGTLAYVPSPSIPLPTSELVRVNRNGEITPLGAPPNTYRERVEVSPDGTMLAVTVQSTTGVRLFLYDLARGTLASAFAQQGARDTIRPIWSPNGQIAMQVYRSGGANLALLSADRTTVLEEPLLPQNGFAPSSWLRKGEALIGHRNGDLWVYKPAVSGEKWERLTDTPAAERYPVWSPDGHWLAYASDVSGRDEIYVHAYPAVGSPVLVSTAGGTSPAWNPNGRELIYTEPIASGSGVGPSATFKVMSVQMTNPANPGRPQRLFDADSTVLPLGQCASTTCYSISPDGQSFYTLRFRARDIPRVTSLRLTLNWFDEVRRLASAK